MSQNLGRQFKHHVCSVPEMVVVFLMVAPERHQRLVN